jgi:hypothetical protein
MELFRWITVSSPDGAFVIMMDYSEAKRDAWDKEADAIVQSIFFH